MSLGRMIWLTLIEGQGLCAAGCCPWCWAVLPSLLWAETYTWNIWPEGDTPLSHLTWLTRDLTC